MREKIKSLFFFCTFLLFPFLIHCQTAPILNPGFEDWEIWIDGTERPADWKVGYHQGCYIQPNMVVVSKDTNALFGNYCLKIKGSCPFWEGGLLGATVSQEINFDGDVPVPKALSFWYKHINIEYTPFDTIGCAIISVRYYYREGGYADNLWLLRTKVETHEWKNARFLLTNRDPEKVVKQMVIKITGGSCSNGIGYSGNSEFLIDGIGDFLLSSDDLIENSVSVFPNPTTGRVFVSSSNDMHFLLLDGLGNVKLQGKIFSDTDSKIDLTYLPSGIYYLTLKNAKSDIQEVREIIKLNN